MLTEEFKASLTEQLSSFLSKKVTLLSMRSVSGGSINQAYEVKTSLGSFFVKVNHKTLYPGMFEAEVKGLNLMRENTLLRVPEPLFVASVGNQAYLVMEYVEQGSKDPSFWKRFGEGLAALHRTTSNHFGLTHNNYIGSLPQQNNQHQNWADFFEQERLRPQIEMANNQLDGRTIDQFEKLFSLLPELFPNEPPALVHGDLWGGNYLCDEKGEPVLIDPAVYFGHREMDLGMTTLFGGFSEALYEEYHRVFPLEHGWRERLDLYNLYPLMVHVNLFGGGYLQSVKQILNRFTS